MKGSMFWKTAIFICTHYLTILSDATLHNLIKVIAIALECEIIWTGPVQRWSCQWVYGKARLLMTQGNKIQGELVFLWGDLPSYSGKVSGWPSHQPEHTAQASQLRAATVKNPGHSCCLSFLSALLMLPFSSSLSFNTLLLHRQVKPRARKMAQQLKVLATKPADLNLNLETQMVKEMNFAKALWLPHQSWDIHTCVCLCAQARTHTQTHTNK